MRLNRKHNGSKGRRKGKIQIAILHLLNEEQMHGYQMIKKLEEKSDGYYVPSAGTIYPALQELHEKGFVDIQENNDKKEYRLNQHGKQFLLECGKDGEEFWSHWRNRIIWKQTKECQQIQEQLSSWENEMRIAEKYVASNLQDAHELMNILADAKEKLVRWNKLHE
ncbi:MULTISPECIES: PadR family transcriptional regulator [Bacillus]|uniref:PadR family transcriptional regulator n=1 Tax=Bacillus TaxID=1386 RepID=UPI000305E91F|nr:MULTISPECIES: PadR family transcriptional regulator [Bacillus]